MRILFVATVFRHLSVFHIPFMLMLKEKGYDIWAVASGDLDHKKELEKYGIKCFDIPFSRKPISIKNLKAYFKLKKFLRKNEFKLIHTHTPVASFLIRIVGRKFKNTVKLYTAHGFHFYNGAPFINWLLYFNAEKFVQRWTNGILVINNEDYNHAIRLGYKKENIFRVNGVGVKIPKNKNNFTKNLLKKELDINNDVVVISFIAELNDNKNHEYLLRNWKEISVICPNAKLLIIGAGENEQKIKNFIHENRLKNIILLGYRRDIYNLLEITDIATLLSKREGLGKSIMEAMTFKIPCIVTNTRGLRDLVKNGENGYVIPHDCDEKLKEAFINLIKNAELRQKMGEKGFEMIQPYDIDVVLKQYEKIYDRFLQ